MASLGTFPFARSADNQFGFASSILSPTDNIRLPAPGRDTESGSLKPHYFRAEASALGVGM
jgi:hypothetical protein